jgi:glycosyltransferase involved in cell wall biosynthesis
VRLLVSHTNYPAQFRRLVPAWVAEGHDVVFLARHREWHAPDPQGFRLIHYQHHRNSGGPSLHPYLRRFETAVIEGQAAYRAAMDLREQGWIPNVIVNHVGFGNGLFLSDAFPEARRIGLFEWFYRSTNSDVDFLPPRHVSPDQQLRLRTWNAQTLLELGSCDAAVVPTYWQLQQFPPSLQHQLQVIHEGVDTTRLAGLRSAGLPRPSCLPNDPSIEVLTYVSRCFEEYRGFPQAIEAIVRLQQRRPKLHVLLVGHDGTAYGQGRSDGRGWAQWARDSLQLDPLRTHWLGSLQEAEYHQVLAHSSVHLYLTVPFVLSWSLLEAMAAGCAVVASSTPPVQEVLEHEQSGLLVDFFDPEAQAQALDWLLDAPDHRERLAKAAQHAARRFGHASGLAAWNHLLASQASSLNPHKPVHALGMSRFTQV